MGRRDVAVIGLGQMGAPIARRLDAAGRLAVAADIAPASVDDLDASSGVTKGSPEEIRSAIGDCAFVLLAVPSSVEIEALLLGDADLLPRLAEDAILVDLTTSDPEASGSLAAKAAERGLAYLDAGMTGGAMAADAGRLTLMVGGDEQALAGARPILGLIASTIFHLGGRGAGHAMKLAHNMICHSIFLATVEGVRLAEAAGLPLERVIEVLNAGNARSFVSEVRLPRHVLSGRFDGRSRTANLAKDLGLAMALADRLEVPTALGRRAAEVLAEAVAQGLGEDDFTRLYEQLSEVLRAARGGGHSDP